MLPGHGCDEDPIEESWGGPQIRRCRATAPEPTDRPHHWENHSEEIARLDDLKARLTHDAHYLAESVATSMLEEVIVRTPETHERRNGDHDDAAGRGEVDVVPQERLVILDVLENINEEHRVGSTHRLRISHAHKDGATAFAKLIVAVVGVDARHDCIRTLPGQRQGEEPRSGTDVKDTCHLVTESGDVLTDGVELREVVPMSPGVDTGALLQIHGLTPRRPGTSASMRRPRSS